MICPRCDHPKLATVGTRHSGFETYRVKHCPACDGTFKSREVFVEEWPRGLWKQNQPSATACVGQERPRGDHGRFLPSERRAIARADGPRGDGAHLQAFMSALVAPAQRRGSV